MVGFLLRGVRGELFWIVVYSVLFCELFCEKANAVGYFNFSFLDFCVFDKKLGSFWTFEMLKR